MKEKHKRQKIWSSAIIRKELVCVQIKVDIQRIASHPRQLMGTLFRFLLDSLQNRRISGASAIHEGEARKMRP